VALRPLPLRVELGFSDPQSAHNGPPREAGVPAFIVLVSLLLRTMGTVVNEQKYQRNGQQYPIGRCGLTNFLEILLSQTRLGSISVFSKLRVSLSRVVLGGFPSSVLRWDGLAKKLPG
jgi:hypothetical protein